MRTPRTLLATAILASTAQSTLAAPDLYVSSFFDNTVVRLDGNTGELLGTVASGGPLNGPQGLLHAPNGNLLVVSRQNSSVLEFDTSTGQYVRTLIQDSGLNHPHGMMWDTQGDLLVGSSTGVFKYDGQTGAPLGLFADTARTVIDLRYGPGGNLLVTTDGGMDEFDAQTGIHLRQVFKGGSPNQFVVGGIGNNLFVGQKSPTFSDGIYRYDAASGDLIGLFASGHGMDDPSASLLRNNRLLVSTGFGNTLIEFDIETGAFLGEFASDGINYATDVLIVPTPATALPILLLATRRRR